MKKIFKALSVIMIVALAFTSMGFANLTKVEAKSAVKSVKVKKAKKKLTLKVGDKKTFKVKVKAKKGKTKFKVKSSNKKVVKVKKKGKKITLTALKVGKAKVTVRSKTNKKKKYVIKVKVIAKNQTETTKPKTTTKPTQPTTKASEPTTAAPTVEPTTVAPTVEPTTVAPTVEPTTEAPVTAAPTTVAPTEGPTVEPTTEAPTEEPTTETPTGETYYVDKSIDVTVDENLDGHGVYLDSDGEDAEIIGVKNVPNTMSIKGIEFDDDDDAYIAFAGLLSVPGSYEFTVTVLDEGDTWVYSITVNVLEVYQVYGQVTDKDGNPLEDAIVYLENDQNEYYCYTDEDGMYYIDAVQGEYLLYAEYDEGESETQTVNLQSDTEKNLVVNDPEYYKVTITSTEIDPKYLGYWEDSYGEGEYYGNELTLRKGEHYLSADGYAYIDGKLCSYHALAEFELTGDMTVEATISDIQEVTIESQQLIVGKQSVSNITEEPKLFKFTPTITGIYRFWSNCTGDDDPFIKVYDSNLSLIGKHDDNHYDEEDYDDDYNFDLTLQLTGGATYYIWLKSWEFDLGTLSMTIKNLLT